MSQLAVRALAIGLAGFLGAVARYLIGEMAGAQARLSFPWATVAINLSGSFLLGLLYAVAEEKLWFGADTRFIIAVGFLGSYTTFSTFSHETVRLLERGSWLMGGANIIASLVGALAAVYAGIIIGRSI